MAESLVGPLEPVSLVCVSYNLNLSGIGRS